MIVMHRIDFNKKQLSLLLALRLAIGWHLLYEGLTKLWQPGWSSRSYLLDSKGFFSGAFHFIASQEQILTWVDQLNILALIVIGFSLILGLASQYGKIAGMVLLGLFYLSHPAWPGFSYAVPGEGNYFIINKNLVEIIALAVLWAFPTSHIIGIDRFFKQKSQIHNKKTLQTA